MCNTEHCCLTGSLQPRNCACRSYVPRGHLNPGCWLKSSAGKWEERPGSDIVSGAKLHFAAPTVYALERATAEARCPYGLVISKVISPKFGTGDLYSSLSHR